jgi:hypothetical protein
MKYGRIFPQPTGTGPFLYVDTPWTKLGNAVEEEAVLDADVPSKNGGREQSSDP